MEVLVDPAVKGTANVLTSVAKTPSVKRVVLTSSCYAVLTDAADCALGKDGWATEEMWNSTASIAYMPYAYSKKAAEEEAWKIAYAQSPESYQFVQMVGNGVMASGAPDLALFMVDVRDVATAHVRAAFTPEAEGRFILVGTNTSLLKMVGTIGDNDKFKDYPLPTFGMPKLLVWLLAPYIGMTRTGIWRGVGWEAKVDNSKSKEILKMEYKPMATTMSDMFRQMVDAGMIDVPKKK
jgi:nucleoside-diphosphate-sugar epimerase